MDAGEVVAIASAGVAAGAINVLVGSGTLITFPVLLAFGYAPVTANVSNTIGLVPGAVSGSIGYRRELAGQRARAVRLGTMSVLGGLTGAAQGIMLVAILGVTLAQDLQRTNALKNVLVGLVNGVAGLYFAFAAHVAWGPAGVIAASSIVGAHFGARYGRRLPESSLRAVIIVVGVVAIVRLLAY